MSKSKHQEIIDQLETDLFEADYPFTKTALGHRTNEEQERFKQIALRLYLLGYEKGPRA